MKRFTTIIIFSILVFVISCEKKAEIQTRDYPYVITQKPVIDSTETFFFANLINAGTQKILAHGFVWSEHILPTISDKKILFENNIVVGLYSSKITYSLKKGIKYYVRAYIKTDKLEVYGNDITFISLSTSPPGIDGFKPTYGTIGKLIEINGDNFSSSRSDNIVKFGTHIAVIESASENKLIVRVPDITKSEKVKISVEIDGKQTTSAESFELLYPWFQKGNFDMASDITATFTLQNIGYLINANFLKMFSYNPETDTWQNNINLPEYSGNAPLSFSANGKGYALFGSNLWEYQPLTENWIKKASYPGTLQYVRNFIFGMSINGNIYIGNCCINYDFWEYNTTQDTWQRKADFIGDLGTIRSNYSFSVNNKGYVGLSSVQPAMRQLYEYNPDSDSWQVKNNFPSSANSELCCFVLNNEAFVGLGYNYESGEISNEIWKYNSQNDFWIKYQNCPANLRVLPSFSINNKGYMVSGFSIYYSLLHNVWEFDPTKN